MSLLLAALALFAWLYLALAHGRFWIPLVDESAPDPGLWPSVDIVIPARNEAETLPYTLPTLLMQDYPGAWRIILVDDHSTDGTDTAARRLPDPQKKLTIVQAPRLPEGWSGKVAAMQTGVAQSDADYVLFTDADIAHARDSLRRLVALARLEELDLTSLMVKLHCGNFAEKLLVPAFVFFFAMLYPFRRANNPKSKTAAAAGGVMLVRKQALSAIGGLARIKSALIDDCSLARAIKDNGGRIRLTLTQKVESVRVYPTLGSIEHMIARTAFTQLRHSLWLLAGTVLGLSVLFLVPVAVPLFAAPKAALIGYAAWALMTALYAPMVRFYRLAWPWVLALPLAAVIYMVATIDSAYRHLKGRGGQWKGRAQANHI